jgi:hypothetical protein
MTNKKLKIAFCYSGFVRNFKNNFEANKNIINFLKPDIFLYTYNTFGYKNNSLIPEPKTNKTVDLSYFDEIKNIKKIKINNFDENYIKNLEDPSTTYYMHNNHAYPKNILSQLNGIYECNKLKKEYEIENNFKYDIVFRVRFDSIFLKINNLKLYEQISSIKRNEIFVSSGYGWGSYCDFCEKKIQHKNHLNDISDIFAFGNSTDMDYYSSLFLVANKIAKDVEHHNALCLNSMDNFKYNENKIIFDLKDLVKTNYLNRNKSLNELFLFYPESLLRLYLFEKQILQSNIKVFINRNELY